MLASSSVTGTNGFLNLTTNFLGAFANAVGWHEGTDVVGIRGSWPAAADDFVGIAGIAESTVDVVGNVVTGNGDGATVVVNCGFRLFGNVVCEIVAFAAGGVCAICNVVAAVGDSIRFAACVRVLGAVFVVGGIIEAGDGVRCVLVVAIGSPGPASIDVGLLPGEYASRMTLIGPPAAYSGTPISWVAPAFSCSV